MVRVFYGQKMNAVLGGVLFIDGIKDFSNDKEGIRFAEMFYRKYEIVKEDKPKAPAKKKVKKDE